MSVRSCPPPLRLPQKDVEKKKKKESEWEQKTVKEGKDISGALFCFAATKEQWASISGLSVDTELYTERESSQLAGSTPMEKSGKRRNNGGHRGGDDRDNSSSGGGKKK